MSRQRKYTLPDGTGTNDVNLNSAAVRKQKTSSAKKLALAIIVLAAIAAFLLAR